MSKVSEAPQQKLTKKEIKALGNILGFGAILLDLGNVDYTRGRLFKTGTNDSFFWTKSGHKASVSISSDGGFVVSLSSEPDENLPGVVFPGYEGD